MTREITRTLGTSDFSEAKEAYHTLASEFERLFAIARSLLAQHSNVPDDRGLKALAAQYFERQDAKSATAFSDIQLTTDDFETARENATEDLNQLASGDPAVIGHFTNLSANILADHRYQVTDGAKNLLAGYLRNAALEVTERDLLRSQGERLRSIPSTKAASADSADLTLAGAFAQYAAVKSAAARSPKTKLGYTYQWRLMSDILGPETPLNSITRQDLRRYAETVKRLPPSWTKKARFAGLSAVDAADFASESGVRAISQNTYEGYLLDVSAFFRWATDEDLVSKNIAKRLVVGPRAQGRKSTRQPFTTTDLQLIFGENFANEARFRSRSGSGPAVGVLPTDPRYWVTLLALFTGMRLNEMCQLRRKDVMNIDGVDCIATLWSWDEEDDEDAGRSLKNENAERVIPVLDELISLGFLRFVAGLDPSPDTRLFPDLAPDKNGYVAAPVSRWFARYLEALGIKTRRKVFHSFRHTFRDAMRRASVSREVVVRIGGWAAGEVSDAYGTDRLARVAKSELERIRYDGLDLRHLYPVP